MRRLKIAAIVVSISAVILTTCGCGAGTSGTESGSAALQVLTAQVMRGDIEETISATGIVEAQSQANLVFESNGIVEDTLVAKGDEVEEGQVLARLDDAQLSDQVARAEASLATALARLDQTKRPASEAEIATAQAGVRSAQASLDRLLAGPTERDLASAQLSVESAQNQLWGAQGQRDSTAGNPMSSQGAVDAAEAQVLSAEISVRQALLAQEKLLEPPSAEDVEIAQSQLDQAKAQLAQVLDRPRAEDVAVVQAQADETALVLAQAQSSLEDALLKAPFEGTILQVMAREGEMTSAAMPAFVIAKQGDLVLSADVDELDVVEIREGQTAWLTFEALPHDKVSGTVTYIASSATNVGGAVAYLVEISFDPGDLPVRLGMTTDVEMVTARAQDVLLAPNQAIESDRAAGRYYVTRLAPSGDTERVEVEIGLRDEHLTQVLSGLAEGDVLSLPQIEGAAESEYMMPGMRMMDGVR